MRSRSARADHQQAVSRRLALLTADLETSRAGPPAPPPEPPEPPEPGDWWSEHTRVSAPALHLVPTPVPAVRRAPDPPPAPVSAPPDPPDPPPVPVPGRHAARRRGRGWGQVAADAVPASLRGRARVGPAQLAVVAVVVAVGALVAAWVVVRGGAEPAAVPAAAPASAQPLVPLVAGAGGEVAADVAPGPAAGVTPAAAAGTVTVDVAGKVRRPGIAVLDAGSRVVDALEAAGGARPGVDLSALNLARLLVDGEQVLVGVAPAAGPVPPPTGGAPDGAVPGAPTALVNLNTATPEQLDALPEVGPVTAAAIVAWREENGAFTSVDQLVEVDGIGEVTLGQIAPHATV